MIIMKLKSNFRQGKPDEIVIYGSSLEKCKR